MQKKVPTRVRVEVAVALASLVLGVITLFWKDWIEVVLRVDPDHGDGSAEWWVVAGLLLIAVTSFAVSRWELRRLETTTSR